MISRKKHARKKKHENQLWWADMEEERKRIEGSLMKFRFNK